MIHTLDIYIFIFLKRSSETALCHRYASATQITLCTAAAALRLLDAYNVSTSYGAGGCTLAGLVCSTIPT